MNKWKLFKLLLILLIGYFIVKGLTSGNGINFTIIIPLIVVLLIFKLIAWLLDKNL
jgi:hypothetical protein